MYKKLLPFVIFLFTPLWVHAAQVIVLPPDHTIGIGEQFYVDLVLDPQGASINGVDDVVNFTDQTLKLDRVEDGSSIVPLWIEKPLATGNTVHFAGIIPNGFSGLIDPFNSGEKKPGKIVRLVFTASRSGIAAVSVQGTLTQNDGNGTTEQLRPAAVSFPISQTPSSSTYQSIDTTPPLLIASRVRDVSLFDNSYALVFSATDKESGVAYVEVQEQKNDWKKISSPYLLEDQSDNATLQVRAVDYAGNPTVVTIGEKIHTRDIVQYVFLALVLLVGFPFMVFYYKRYASKKI